MSRDRLTALTSLAALGLALLAVARTAARTPSPRDMAQAGGEAGGSQTEHERDGGRARAEWVTVGISAGLILLVAALIVYSHLLTGDAPASIRVTPQFEQLREEAGSHYLPVSIENTGDQTAEDIRIELSVPSPTGGRETSQVSIQFLSGGESADAVAVFRQAPSPDTLTTDVISFLKAG